MAAKKKKITVKNREVVSSTPFEANQNTDVRISRWRLVTVTLGLILLVGFFWYKTNSWPVVSLVDNRPIFRFQVDQMLFAQGGAQALDSLIVEQLIANDISNKNIQVSDEEIQAKLDQIKTQIGSEEAFAQALTAQGLTEDSLKKQFKLQLGLEKLVEPSTDSAVLQERIYTYVEALRASSRVKTWTSTN